MTPDEMKTAWQELSDRIDKMELRLGAEQEHGERWSQRRTSLDNLSARYRKFSLLALGCTLTSLGFMNFPELPERLRLWLTVGFAIFFATCSVMDYWLYTRTKALNLSAMTVSEVCRKAAGLRRMHHRFMMILIPMAVTILGILAYWTNEWFRVGMIAGAAVGLIIGLKKYSEFMADYRALTE